MTKTQAIPAATANGHRMTRLYTVAKGYHKAACFNCGATLKVIDGKASGKALSQACDRSSANAN